MRNTTKWPRYKAVIIDNDDHNKIVASTRYYATHNQAEARGIRYCIAWGNEYHDAYRFSYSIIKEEQK